MGRGTGWRGPLIRRVDAGDSRSIHNANDGARRLPGFPGAGRMELHLFAGMPLARLVSVPRAVVVLAPVKFIPLHVFKVPAKPSSGLRLVIVARRGAVALVLNFGT